MMHTTMWHHVTDVRQCWSLVFIEVGVVLYICCYSLKLQKLCRYKVSVVSCSTSGLGFNIGNNNDNDCVLVMPLMELGTELQGCSSINSDWKHVNAPLAASTIQSTHDHGTAQHYSQLVLAVSRFWGGRKTGVPWEKPSESGWDRPITHPTYAPDRN